ncbi:ArsR/SmtB family transcription factor [Amycolatopsis pithecellobii]|uniref:Helix-turn-helix domain-containing protein n=1 Tax=Amycolatopsis pithecellobii TaxID=664692 RepID=A0A6N7Z2D5_9PSEU|nr:metalloregulator ArsR/SmtB family transcription factor [Amycolatopsis pithecellobii]MTD52826.1 helix-turn-helix domain-containing protein [Amycolatopsis pithecellobii]
MRQLPHPDLQDVSVPRVLSALGDPVRLGMVRTLSDGEEHLRGEFEYELAQSTISHHVKTLVDAGIALARREGTRCFVSLRPQLEDRFPGLLTAVLAQQDSPR